MIYTSGTTGHPKGVKRQPATPEESKAYVELFASVYGLKPGVRALVTARSTTRRPTGTAVRR
jgi:long-chain acyl-CoA synthetase